ncbi:unnamed protein product [Aureobasidium vineae]|uniref:Tail specific protease domain-containing protein n=1 Tax=Aureobasidium vineae TaxID=2773715 RepID=A0A9N8J935_9PEZI|nr:unnamed protein product [Aureobasidium vineae]
MSLRVALVALAAIANSVHAQDETSRAPCSQLSALSANDTKFFPADLALSCLRSVPLAKEDDLLQLSGLRTFLEFQSDLDYLADPTVGRIYPGIDLLAGLDKLTSMLEDDIYQNEHDFQMDVFKLFSAAYDGHLSYIPDIVDVFAFGRLQSEDVNDEGIANYFSLISVLTVENDTPDIYAYIDENSLADPGNSDYSPSPVTKINGQDVVAWLNSYAAQNGRSQDPDANYNQVFVNIPKLAYEAAETDHFAVSRFYQGNTTMLTFANESTRDVMTRAQLLSTKTLEGLTDGASFFDRFCNNNLTETILAQANATGTAPLQTTSNITRVPYEPVSTEGVAPPHPAYPSPIVISSDKSVAGYFSDTISDLAILSVPSFSTTSPVEFENVVRQLLATASDNERTKLVIDLRGNGGGTIFLAYDLFRQLFPTEVPYGAGNYRASELHNFTGRVASENIDALSAAYPELVKSGVDGVVLNSFNYREPLTVDNEQFTSWEEFFGPHKTDRGDFTSLNRFNLTDISATTIPILGYADDNTTQPRTFAPKDIVLLHDGTCASTCAIFSELMSSQMSISSIAAGGRPQKAPMQAVGGTKGSQVQGMFILSTIVSAVLAAAPPSSNFSFLSQFGTDILTATNQALSRASFGGTLLVKASVNFRNNVRGGDAEQMPLQYVYQAADCRFFYTAQMYADQAAVWDKAYDATWGSMQCVEGSTSHPSSVTGGANITAGPPDTAKNFFGGNASIALGRNLETVWTNGSLEDGGGNGSGNGSTSSGNGTTEGSSDGEGDDKSGSNVLAVPLILTSSLAISVILLFI